VRRALLLLAVLGSPGRLVAQDNATRALELERRGDYAGAASAWRAQIATHPTDLAALLGLERALTPLGRLAEMTGPVQAAAQREPSAGVLGIAIRVWTAARQPDSARAAVVRWAALEPASEMPFQEWGIAAYSARDRASARAAYLLGRQKLGRPDAMAAELGQLAVADGITPTRWRNGRRPSAKCQAIGSRRSRCSDRCRPREEPRYSGSSVGPAISRVSAWQPRS
jgi:hypothetical protein